MSIVSLASRRISLSVSDSTCENGWFAIAVLEHQYENWHVLRLDATHASERPNRGR